MSSAIARARSPATSISATLSHSRASAILAAVVAPTMPAPTTATRVIPAAPAGPSRGARPARRAAASRGGGTRGRATGARACAPGTRGAGDRSWVGRADRRRPSSDLLRLEVLDGVDGRVTSGQDLALGAREQRASEAPDVREVDELDVRGLLGLVHGKRDGGSRRDLEH